MARTYNRRTDDIEEFNDDALHIQEADAGERSSERALFQLEEDEGETLELGYRGRKSFDRLNDEDLFRSRD